MRLTIYSKPGCHLCDDMKLLVRRAVATRSDIVVDEIDISADANLMELYQLEIPVLAIDGKKVAKYRITEADLTRMLAARQPWRHQLDP